MLLAAGISPTEFLQSSRQQQQDPQQQVRAVPSDQQQQQLIAAIPQQQQQRHSVKLAGLPSSQQKQQQRSCAAAGPSEEEQQQWQQQLVVASHLQQQQQHSAAASKQQQNLNQQPGIAHPNVFRHPQVAVGLGLMSQPGELSQDDEMFACLQYAAHIAAHVGAQAALQTMQQDGYAPKPGVPQQACGGREGNAGLEGSVGGRACKLQTAEQAAAVSREQLGPAFPALSSFPTFTSLWGWYTMPLPEYGKSPQALEATNETAWRHKKRQRWSEISALLAIIERKALTEGQARGGVVDQRAAAEALDVEYKTGGAVTGGKGVKNLAAFYRAEVKGRHGSSGANGGGATGAALATPPAAAAAAGTAAAVAGPPPPPAAAAGPPPPAAGLPPAAAGGGRVTTKPPPAAALPATTGETAACGTGSAKKAAAGARREEQLNDVLCDPEVGGVEAVGVGTAVQCRVGEGAASAEGALAADMAGRWPEDSRPKGIRRGPAAGSKGMQQSAEGCGSGGRRAGSKRQRGTPRKRAEATPAQVSAVSLPQAAAGAVDLERKRRRSGRQQE